MYAHDYRAGLCLALMLFARWLNAQVLLNGTSYSQNFDSLSVSGSANTWTDGSTLPGWYAGAVGGFGGDYRAGSGTSTTGDLYSFGLDSDRALGSLASGTTRDMAFGVRLRNATAGVLSQFTISFSAEQWRDSNTTPQSLQFSYQTSSSTISSADPANAPGSGGWLAVPALNFSSLQNSGSGALNGNLAPNHTVFSATSLSGLELQPGHELFLRWFDINDSGNDHGFAVDDVSVLFTPVPEPEETATFVCGILVVVAVVFKVKRRNLAQP